MHALQQLAYAFVRSPRRALHPGRAMLGLALATVCPSLCSAAWYAYTTSLSDVYLANDPDHTDVAQGNNDPTAFGQTTSSHSTLAANSGFWTDYGGTSWGWDASADGFASASGGAVHLNAHAVANLNPGTITQVFPDGTAIIPSPLNARSGTMVTGEYTDVFHIGSKSNQPVGTPVQFAVSARLHVSFDVNSDSQGYSTALARCIVSGTDGIASLSNPSNYDGELAYIVAGTNIAGISTPSSVVTVHVGDTVTLGMQVSAEAHASAYYFDPSAHALADASNTAFLYFDPIGTDATYTTDSGLSYTTPVPEPAGLSFLGIGGWILLRRARRGGAEQVRR